jgi:uncharacterized membrane protein
VGADEGAAVGTLGAVGALVGALVGVAVGKPVADAADGANVGAFDGDDVMPHRGIAAAHIATTSDNSAE